MSKVKCKVCANECGGVCSVKNMGIKPNKRRVCTAFVYDQAKVKQKTEIPITRITYREQQEAKRRFKAEIKEMKRLAKEGPKQGTASNLGLIEKSESAIIKPGDPNFSMPNRDLKYPLTGDLSRFTTTASDED